MYTSAQRFPHTPKRVLMMLGNINNLTSRGALMRVVNG